MPSYYAWRIFRGQAKKHFYTLGVGRHSNEEIEEWMKNDLRKLSDILGKYFDHKQWKASVLIQSL